MFLSNFVQSLPKLPFNRRIIPGIFLAFSLFVSLWYQTKLQEKSASLLSPLPQEIIDTLVKFTKTQINSDDKACNISDTFSPEVKHWENDICRWSKEHGMDANLIATIMQIESCGNSVAISATGVRGLFQVTGANLDGQDPYDPNVSMAKGPGKVLKNELDASEGNVKAAMAGYNGGAKARDYIAGKITKDEFYWFLVNHPSRLWRTKSKALAKINEVERYAQWADIYFESESAKKDTLTTWWDLGGYRLCQSASSQIASTSN